MKRFLERVKKIAVTSFSAKWWNPLCWLAVLLLPLVGVVCGLAGGLLTGFLLGYEKGLDRASDKLHEIIAKLP